MPTLRQTRLIIALFIIFLIIGCGGAKNSEEAYESTDDTGPNKSATFTIDKDMKATMKVVRRNGATDTFVGKTTDRTNYAFTFNCETNGMNFKFTLYDANTWTCSECSNLFLSDPSNALPVIWTKIK